MHTSYIQRGLSYKDLIIISVIVHIIINLRQEIIIILLQGYNTMKLNK